MSNQQTQKPRRKLLRIISFTLLGIIAAFLGISGGYYAYLMKSTVPLSDDQLQISKFTSTVYDKTGKTEIGKLSGSENRVWVDIKDMPKNLISAIIAIEDKDFYNHKGFDYFRFLGGIFSSIGGKSSKSTSTITTQVVKNITNEKEISISRKVQEMIRAQQLEKKLNKDQILELYLNLIYLGGGETYGVGAAAKKFFNKEVLNLTLAECACLAALPEGPATYNPLSEEGLAKNKVRRELILKAMLEQKKIDQNAYKQAINEKVQIASPADKNADASKLQDVQSYFVDFLIVQVVEDLKAMGIDEEVARKNVYNSGWKIYSTMDVNAQKVMDDVFNNSKNFPHFGKTLQSDEPNYKQHTNTPYDPQAGMTLIDPATGEIRAIYGGFGPKKAAMGYNTATNASRNPGNVFAPLAAYAPALDMKKITADSTFDDSPIYLNPKKPDIPYPKNFGESGTKYWGKVSTRTAIAKSLNVPAALIWQTIDIKEVANYLNKFGFKETKVNNTPAYPIGGVLPTSTLQIASAYSTFANKGIRYEPITYTKIVDRNGKVILDKKSGDKEKQSKVAVFSNPTVSDIMLDMLQNVAKPEGTASYINLKNAKDAVIPVACKTGTTDLEIDRWFVGMTPYYTAAVWYGDSKNLPLSPTPQNPAAFIWMEVMKGIHEDLDVKEFPKTAGNTNN